MEKTYGIQNGKTRRTRLYLPIDSIGNKNNGETEISGDERRASGDKVVREEE